MINDILDLAKIESGKMEVRPEDFSIRDVCESLANLKPGRSPSGKEIDLICRLDDAIPAPPPGPRQGPADPLQPPVQRDQVHPSRGKVTLDALARAEGRNVVIAVADTGIGIAEEDRDKIFEKFRRGPASPGRPTAS